MFPRHRNRHGFTLVELLVVIGIIALLAAILLPVLANAISSARSARCKNHLTQLCKGMRMYLNNFGEYFPASFHKSGDSSDLATYAYSRFAIHEHTDSSFNHILSSRDTTNGVTTQDKFQATRLFWECAAEGWTKEYFGSKLAFKDPGGAASFDQHTQYNALVASVSSTERPLLTEVDASYAKGTGAYAEGEYKNATHKTDVEGGFLIVSDPKAESGKGIFKGAEDSLRTATDYTTARFDFRHNHSVNILFLDSHVVGVRQDDGALLKRIHDRWNKMVPPAATTP
jgi:prepilin-type N-terminal cleavage/methylation domain-containing protein/prepilin-type processing-associated H-X9-DG protein